MALDGGTALLKQVIGTAKFVVGTKANVDTAAVAVGSDTDLLRDITIQNDPANTGAILLGDTASQVIRLNSGASMTVQARKVTDLEVKAQGADTDITVNYLGGIV